MRGTGKTALFADLAGRLDQQVAFARIDCEGFDGDARDLLSLIAFDLNRQSGRYGSLPFPRLITGQIAITASPEHHRPRGRAGPDPPGARGEPADRQGAQGRVQRHAARAGSRPWAGLTASPARPRRSRPWPAGTARTWSSAVWPRARRGRRLLLGKGQDWYGHQDRDLGRNPLDVLVDLNRMAALPDAEGNRREVAELLWAAFLADLRDSFAHSRHASSWTLNCAVLLDNVDTRVGHDFLDELIMARRQRAAHAADDPDPLTVVATSRGDLAERVRVRGESAVTLTSAGYSDYLAAQPDAGRSVVVPGAAARPDARRGRATWSPRWSCPAAPGASVTSAVHRFTAGHPGATRMMLDAIAEHPDNPARPAGDPDRPRARGARPPGAARSRKACSTASPRASRPEAVADLATCAAARSEEAALRLAAESGLLTGMRGEDSVIFAADLWRTGPPDRAAQLHPMLWRLLLRRLAKRDPGAAADWSERVRLAAGHAARMPATRPASCITRSPWARSSTCPGGSRTRWNTATRPSGCGCCGSRHRGAQPAGLPAAARDPRSGALTRWAERREQPLALIGRLVAASWIYADPLSAAHRRSLLREMSADLHQIATYCPGRPDGAARRGRRLPGRRRG